MISLVIKSITQRKMFSVIFILAVLVILLIFSFTLEALKSNSAQIQANIVHHARGSYDILVRPSDARNHVEKTFGVVEDNYLSVGSGGISIKQ